MKHSLILITIVSLVTLGFMSCEQMEDFHYEYIKDGEVIYTTKVDSVITYAGDSRLMISGILDQPFGVNQVRVYYNNRADSIFMNYQQVNDVDTITVMLDDMEEKSYSFDIYTADIEGHRSVKVIAFGTVYGERFRSNLLSRVIDTDSTRDGHIYLNWLPADEMERGTEIKFTDLTDTEINLQLSQDSGWIELADFKSGMSYRSSYIPELTALDTFIGDWVDMEMQIFESQGIFKHPVLGETAFGFDKVLRTISPNTYEAYFADQVGNREGTRMKLHVEGDNSVEVTFVGSTYVLEPNGENTFNPTTGVFTLNYQYDWTLGARTISETLTLK